MNKLLVVYFSIVSAVLLLQNIQAADTTSPSESSSKNNNILFVGNSFSYFNNGIHNHVSNLVRASETARNQKSSMRLMTISGSGLVEHYSGLSQILKTRKWDKVVLQPYSNAAIVDTKRYKQFQESSKALAKLVREYGAEPISFMSWAYKNEPKMMDKLKYGFISTAKPLNMKVVPVGLVFEAVKKKYPNLELYSADVRGFDEEGNALYKKIVKHPSLAGTYLAACTFFASFYDQSPEGFAYTAGLPAEDAKHLQQIAWETVQSFKKMKE